MPGTNLQLLFDVLARVAGDPHRDYRLLVVGDGIEREQRQKNCEATLPGRAFFVGHIRDSNVLADLYSNSDVFVHPNPREPFGIAPLEAMASGLPLVVPNTGGVTSYANMENAWTVNPDAESFAAAIEEAATSPVRAAEKTAKALETVQRYRWENVAPSFLDLYEHLHRHSLDASQSPSPAFYSIPAKGLEAALTRSAAGLAVRGFQLWMRFASPDQGSDAEWIATSYR